MNEELQTVAKANNIEGFSYIFDKMMEKLFVERIDCNEERYALYSRDIDQDGVVDAKYALLVYNDIARFVTVYIVPDVNGDFITDASDALLVDNNSANFVTKVTP